MILAFYTLSIAASFAGAAFYQRWSERAARREWAAYHRWSRGGQA